MDYQTQQELSRKADLWKVEELSRQVDSIKREYSSLNDNVQRLQNNNSTLHNALREMLQVFVEAENVVHIDDLHRILNQL